MADLANNPQGGGAVAPAASPELADTQTGDNQELNQDIDAEAGDGQTDSDATEDEFEEIEREGKKAKIPKWLKPELLMQSDYTKKTQEVAETRKALEERQAAFTQQAEMQRQNLADVAKVVSLNERLQEYEKLDWAALNIQDAATAQTLWFQYQQLKDAAGKASSELRDKLDKQASETQRSRAKQIDDCRSVLQREIKDWSPQVAGKLTEFAVKEYGFTPQELGTVTDPRIIKVLHRAMIGDQAIKSAAAAKKFQESESVKPVPQVGNRADAGARKTTDASGDKLSWDEWKRRETERVAKRNGARA